jgi:hypothetical protein
VDDDGDDEEELQHEDGGGYFAEEEDEDDGADGEGGGEAGELPEDGALDEAGDGDKEFVAEVELPVGVEESSEAEDVGLHGGDDDDLVGAVGGVVVEEEEGVAEGRNEGEDRGDSEGQGGFHGCSACGFGPDGWIRCGEFSGDSERRKNKQRQYSVASPFGLASGLRQSGFFVGLKPHA